MTTQEACTKLQRLKKLADFQKRDPLPEGHELLKDYAEALDLLASAWIPTESLKPQSIRDGSRIDFVNVVERAELERKLDAAIEIACREEK